MKTKTLKLIYFLSARVRSLLIQRSALLIIPMLLAALSFAHAQAPDDAPPVLTVEDYQKALSFKIANPEEDTYVKIENTYMLDREAKPYVFRYNDGIERRIYLYKILKGSNRDQIGTLALYTTPKSGKTINLCIPGSKAEKKAWDLYIDALKLQGEKEQGLLSTLAFAVSRELSQQMTSPDMAQSTSAEDEGDYNFCFPGEALVTLADRTLKPIAQIAAGDKVMAFDPETKENKETTVTEVQKHHRDGGIPLTRLLLIPVEEILASTGTVVPSAPLELQATHNHPIHTREGKKTMGQIREGDVLFYFDKGLNEFREYRVAETLQNHQKTDQVYNLITEVGNYLVNGMVVLDK